MSELTKEGLLAAKRHLDDLNELRDCENMTQPRPDPFLKACKELNMSPDVAWSLWQIAIASEREQVQRENEEFSKAWGKLSSDTDHETNQ